MPAYLSKFLSDRVDRLIERNQKKPPQGTEAWNYWRYNHLNSSEAHAPLSNEKHGKSAGILAYEKTTPYEPQGEITDPYLKRGHRQEPMIRDIYSTTTGSKVYHGFGSFEHYRHPFLAASVDFVIGYRFSYN